MVILLSCVYSFGFYSYKFISLQVVESSNNISTDGYVVQTEEIDKTMGYIHTTLRDGLCVLLIIVLNILTVIQIRNMLSKKKNLTKGSKSERVQNAETRLTLMVFTMSTLTFIGHGFNFVAYVNPKNNFFWANGCYRTLKYVLFWYSYEINFFFYYFFNLNFQKIVKKYFAHLLKQISPKRKTNLSLNGTLSYLGTVNIPVDNTKY